MTKNGIGFYWTLPVPWAGFEALPANIEEAAKLSRTIRYQQTVIRAYAKAEGYTLLHEEAFLELEPDRGTEQIHGPLKKIKRLCRSQDATLLYVDFWRAQGWRNHGYLRDWISHAGIRTEEVPPEPVSMDGKEFDPQIHFAEWRHQQQAWMAGKAARADVSYGHASTLRDEGLSYPEIAERLNEKGLPNLTGKPWAPDNLRKFMEKMKSQ